MRVDSPFFTKVFPGTKPIDWLMMDTPEVRIGDNKDPDGTVWFYCCLRNKPWQDYRATVCKRNVQETGADYIRLDEAGISFMPCHNPPESGHATNRAHPGWISLRPVAWTGAVGALSRKLFLGLAVALGLCRRIHF